MSNLQFHIQEIDNHLYLVAYSPEHNKNINCLIEHNGLVGDGESYLRGRMRILKEVMTAKIRQGFNNDPKTETTAQKES